MPFFIKTEVTYGWAPAGAGGAGVGQPQSNFPGTGATPGSGYVFVGQSASDIVGEAVPGGDSPSGANFQTAINAAATDLYTRLTTANAVPGFTSGTLLAQVQAWSTGGA